MKDATKNLKDGVQPPSFDDVLKRMLASPPEPHVKKKPVAEGGPAKPKHLKIKPSAMGQWVSPETLEMVRARPKKPAKPAQTKPAK